MLRPLLCRAGQALTAFLLISALQSHPGLLRPAAAELPDSILVSIGDRTIDDAEFLRQWVRVGSRLVEGDATPEEQKRQLLKQLIDREVLAQSSYQAGYAPGEAEQARLGALRQALMRRVYYQRSVLEGLPEDDVDARMDSEKERYEALVERLVAPLEPSYVDSNLVFLADGFRELPGTVQEGDGYVKLQMALQFPQMTPADSSRVLATSELGDFTIGRFWWHWGQVSPMERVNPASPDEVSWWIERFLAQGPMDAEARELGYDRLPEVEQAVARQRDGFAAEWYYKQFILIEADTSEAALRAHWEKDPSRYNGTAHYLHLRVWFERESSADSALSALRAGAEWPEIIDSRFGADADPVVRRRYLSPQAMLVTTPDSVLQAWFVGAEPGDVFGPRHIQDRWWIYQFLSYKDGRRTTFEEAQFFVLQEVLELESDRLLREKLDELRTHFEIEINEAALSALELPDAAPAVHAPSSDREPLGDTSTP